MGLTGKFNYTQRLLASQKIKDNTISGHDSTQVLRSQIPRFIQRSMRNIDKFKPPEKQRHSYEKLDSENVISPRNKMQRQLYKS